MSFNGLAASFLPFTINGLTDATFSNSNIGNAIATTLQLTSATPLKLARFNADRELVSASVDESEVALLVGNNTFKGSQTILPGTSTNINNVITTAITAEAYTEADFTTSGISGYAAPLGTLSGPIAGEYSIGQTANDRTIMKINGFVPTEKTWVYSFMIRIVDAAEGYLSVEQSGVQRSSTLRLITSELTMVSDTFTYDPTSGDIVFKIYTGSLDPWNASWSSFTLGSYTAAIMAPLSAPLVATTISTDTISTATLVFPSISSINSESWSVYSISTMGNPSSLGGLIFQEATLGVGAYITGGVVGATSFRFNTISGDAGKVVVTNGDQVMSTSISAGQLQYITGLTSQAGGIGQTNTWTGANDFTGTTSVAALRITSSVVNADYTLSVNSSDQLEFSNLSNGSIFKTNGADLFVSGDITCASLGATNVEAGSNIYLAKGSVAEWRTTLGMSDEYEILDDAGVMRSRLSKITGLTVSSLSITQVPSATPTLALGLDGSNSVVSFPVPTATNILPLANTFTNTNTFLSTLTAGVGYTTSINGALSTTLNDLGFTSASFTTAGISGAYTPPLGTITNPSGSTYQITQTAQGRSIMAISGFTPSVGITYVFSFNIKCTVGTATISVEQDNILVSPALYPLTTGFNRVIGSFTYNGTPNTVVFKIYTGVASWNAQWDSFTLSTYSIGMNADMNALTVSNRFTQRYNALSTDVSTLVNRATMDSAISAIPLPPNLLPLSNVWTGTNTFQDTVQVSGVGVNLGVSLGSIIKTTATVGSFSQLTGGNATNSPFLEFHFGGSRRGYIGDVTATDFNIVSDNGARLNFYTAGTSRMTIDTAGIITMRPTANPIVIGADGVIKWSNPNGTQSHWGYPSGGGSDNYIRGTNTIVDTPLTLNNGTYVFNSIPYNTYIYAHSVVLEGATLRRSQCLMRRVYQVDYISWGPGINMAYAFFKYSEVCPVRISGKYSGYCTFVGMPTMTMRIYSQSSGATRYYSFPTYQNITYAQTTYPIDIILDHTLLPELGWFDIYIYNSYGMSTDINNQLWVNVQLLPVNSF